MADQQYSDDQLLQLLKDAEGRLRSVIKTQETPAQSLVSLQDSISKGSSEKQIISYINSSSKIAQVDPRHLATEEQRKLADGARVVLDPIAVKLDAAKVKKATAGSQWFNLPRTNLTPELKRDLQLLHMRGVLDPKRHYKKEGAKPKIPEFSQVGTIIEGPTEFFTGRLSNKDRKRTFVEEVLNTEKASGRFKNKYGEIQAAKTSGKKAHYKTVKAKRSGGRISKG